MVNRNYTIFFSTLFMVQSAAWADVSDSADETQRATKPTKVMELRTQTDVSTVGSTNISIEKANTVSGVSIVGTAPETVGPDRIS